MKENDLIKIHRVLINTLSEYNSFLTDEEKDDINEALEIVIMGMKKAEASYDQLPTLKKSKPKKSKIKVKKS